MVFFPTKDRSRHGLVLHICFRHTEAATVTHVDQLSPLMASVSIVMTDAKAVATCGWHYTRRSLEWPMAL